MWCNNLKVDPSWIPNCSKNEWNVFTEEQEQELLSLVKYIIQELHLPITNALFRQITTTYYYNLPEQDHLRPHFPFICCNHFIKKFRERHRISILRARPTTSKEEIARFRADSKKNIFEKVDDDHIANVDETFWTLITLPNTNWADTNSDSVTIYPDVNEKRGFTAIGTILKSGKKLPLVCIVRGKTLTEESHWFGEGHHIEGEERKFQPGTHPLDSLSHNGPRRLFVPTYQTDHSEKGWVNKYIWPRYLRFLRNQIPCKEGTELNDPVNTIYLFADAYRTHHSTELVAYAKTLNIIMIEIPKGTTDQCQPLDCRIFGILKSQARAYYNRRVGKYIREHYEDLRKGAKIPPINPITIKQSAFLLDLLWNGIKEYHIHSAWHTAFDMDRD